MINFKENEELSVLNHSCAHLMAQAVKHLYPEAKFWVGPVVEEGFYYDIDLGEDVIRDEDLAKIEKEMKKCAKDAKRIVRQELSKEEALEMFKDDEYKVDLISRMDEEETVITCYTQGDFTDLCRGPHVDNTKLCKNFKLLKHSGAYWKGDAKNKVLQRIYGVCFPTVEELEAHLAELEEAKLRDHRKLGKDMKLFMFSETVGAGLPMWLPNGFTIRRLLSDYIMDKELASGYEHVMTPVVASTKLYKISGHLEHYKDDMFPIMNREEDPDEYVLRPMNCPEHMIMYKSTLHSYRDLPVRIAEIAHDFRYEAAGALTGIERSRSFTQNDSHIFATPEQIGDEIKNVTKLILDVYKDFGLDKYEFRLSLRDKENTEKYFGNDELWERSEAELREVLKEMDVPYYEAEGEAAFYGPKIDVQVRSALGHDITLSTMQLDYQLPERFELEYVDNEGNKVRPVVIHRAILGSLDRFVAFLLEETKGVLPTWLCPEQVVIIPVAIDAHSEYAFEINQLLKANKIRSKVDNRNEKLGYRIREAQTNKIPVEVVVGDGEIAERSVTVRRYGSKEEVKLSLDEFISALKEEIDSKA